MMGRIGVIVFAIFAAMMFGSFEEMSAIKCWRCSSDGSNANFCNDPFDESNITEKQKRWSYVECTFPRSPPNELNHTAVCRKMKEVVNAQVVITRSCYWEDEDASKDSCMNDPTPSYVKREFCETCSVDGCNSM